MTAGDARDVLPDAALGVIGDLAGELAEVKASARVLLAQADAAIAALRDELRCARTSQANADARASVLRASLVQQAQRARVAERERDEARLEHLGQLASRRVSLELETSGRANAERVRAEEYRARYEQALRDGLAACERLRGELRQSEEQRASTTRELARIRAHAALMAEERERWRSLCVDALAYGLAECERLRALPADDDGAPAGAGSEGT